MKRIIIGLMAGTMFGLAIGFAVGIFVYPYWFLRDVATEQLDGSSARMKLSSGRFIDVNPSDPVHWGLGAVTLFREPQGKAVVFLHDDFEVGPGPRFHVYLLETDEVKSAGDFESSQKTDLGRLRAFKGSQIYAIPAGIDMSTPKSVVIWCKEFGVLISPAALKRALETS